MEDKMKEMLQKLKETAVVVGDKTEDAVKQIGKKTGETVELAKLNMKIFDLKTEIGIEHREIGKLMYAIHVGKEVEEKAVDERLKSIDSKLAEIAQYQERIAELKKAVVCPSCGEVCSKSDSFCKKCGSELNK